LFTQNNKSFYYQSINSYRLAVNMKKAYRYKSNNNIGASLISIKKTYLK